MKGLYFDRELTYSTTLKEPDTGGEALISVSLAGICNTDLEIVKGYMGFSGIPGHEFVGIVKDAPQRQWLGKRVVGEINVGCGHCEFCNHSLQRHCPNRTTLGIMGRNGAFAEYLTLPVENLHLVPEEVTDESAVFVEPVAAACEILEQIKIEEGTPVAVLGDGKLGLLIAQVLHASHLDITLVGHHPDRATQVTKGQVKIIDESAVAGKKFPVVVEATGSPEALNLSLDLLYPRGTLVLKSTTALPPEFHPARLVIDEITVVGSRCGQFRPALELLQSGKVSTDGLVDSIYPLEEGLQGFEKASGKGAGKVLLKI